MCIIKAIGKISKNVNIDRSKYGFQSVGIKKSYPLILNTFQYYVAIESGNQKNITANIRNVGQSSKTKGNIKQKQTQFNLKPENKGKMKMQSSSSNGSNIAARALKRSQSSSSYGSNIAAIRTQN